MQVRFFAGTKADYLSLSTPRNSLGLYFCADTKELFWADRLLTDGTRIVPTYEKLPSFETAAEGITYFVEETRNGYVLSANRTKWIQVIFAPESSIASISFAGTKMTEVDGIFTIDRATARAALGLIFPEGMEDKELEIATKDYVDELIANIPGSDLNLSEYVKQEVLDEYAKKADIPSIEGLATEQFVLDTVATQVPVEELAKKEEVDEVKTKLESEVLPTIKETIIPTVQELAEKAATQDWVKAQGYLTEHQSLEGLATESFVIQKIIEAELSGTDVDVSNLATKGELAEVEAKIPSIENLTSEVKTYTDAEIAKVTNAIAIAKSEAIFEADSKLATKVNISDFEQFKTESIHDIVKDLTANTDDIVALSTAVEGHAETIATYTRKVDELDAAIAAIVPFKPSTEFAVASDGTIGIGQMSTDKLVQGTDTIVLNGGNASIV
jgi:hypothetical protein